MAYDVDFIKGWMRDYYKVSDVGNNQHAKSTLKQEWVTKDSRTETVKSQLKERYESGYGFKRMSKELDSSYTKLRNIFKNLEIDHRTGRSVVTDELRKVRSENVKGELSPWFNWTEKYPHLLRNTTTGIQGYYKRKSGEYVWLRSCWEYIFAKWLDSNDKNWEYETRTYTFDDFSYRPDFIVFDEDGITIYEVKSSYYGVRKDKINELRKVLSPCEKLKVIQDIGEYTDLSYTKELREWKKIKLSKDDLEKRQK